MCVLVLGRGIFLVNLCINWLLRNKFPSAFRLRSVSCPWGATFSLCPVESCFVRLVLFCFPLSCSYEAFDASEVGSTVLSCLVSSVLSCLPYVLCLPSRSLVSCIRVSCTREMPRKVIRDIRSSRGRDSRPVLSCFVCLVLSSYILHCLYFLRGPCIYRF